MRASSLDLFILIAYLAGITLFGIRFRRGQRDLRDYFLGGRTAPWWAIAGSIVATETSTLTIIGTPAIAFAGNLGFLQVVFGYLIARVVISLVLLPQYFRGEFFTAYQLIEARFGAGMKRLTASVFLVTRALAEGVRINAIGKVVSVAFGTGERLSVALVTLLTIIYTFEGGMRAVIWTDLVQLVLYLAGSATAFFLLLQKIPGGWAGVAQTAAGAGHKLRVFDFSLNLTQEYTFWAGVIGGTFLTMASHGTDQAMVQRLLAARNERESRTALLSSGILILVQFTLFLLLGVMLFAYNQHAVPALPAGDPDRLFPEFIVQAMPVGLAGLALAAIFAVAMSNASGSLNSLASSTIFDFAGRNPAEANQGRWLRISRWTTVGWGVVLGLLGILPWGPVLVAGLTIASITYGSLLGVFLLGTWNQRANARGAAAGMLVGLTAMILVKLFTPLAWTWYVLAGTLLTFVAGSLVSLLAPSARTEAQ